MRISRIILFFWVVTLVNCTTKSKSEQHQKDKSKQHTRLYADKPLQKVVELLSEDNYIGDCVGIACSTYKLDLYNQLNEIATSGELISLTDHRSSSVRYYSFRALLKRRDDRVFDMLVKHTMDTSHLVSYSGCLGHYETLGASLVRLIESERLNSNDQKLTDKQLRILDTIYSRHPNLINALP